MNKYEKELQMLRPDDEVQPITYNINNSGYDFIPTAGHGYLVVPRDNIYWPIANSIVEYGYIGQYAIYLEEDMEAGLFLKHIRENENKRRI